MFYDLNLPYNADSPELPRSVALLNELGYNAVALSHTITGKLPGAIVNPIPENPFPSLPNLKILRRVTLVLDDPSQNHRLAALANAYDIVAIRPTSEKLLQQACSSLDCDLISLDFSQRLQYHLKHKVVGTALQRGLCFEIGYSASITDFAARRNVIANAAGLIRATRGRGIVISSEARKAVGLRAPFDVMNLAALWGLSQEKGRDAISGLSRGVVVQAQMKRRSFKGVVDIIDDGVPESEKSERKRKAEEELDKNKKKQAPNAKGGGGGGPSQTDGQPLSKNARKRAAKAAKIEAAKAAGGVHSTSAAISHSTS